jgi:hypothetical protein
VEVRTAKAITGGTALSLLESRKFIWPRAEVEEVEEQDPVGLQVDAVEVLFQVILH